MKITLTDVKSGYNLSPLNANFQALQTQLQDKVLYRDNPTGEPNQMEGPLDMNSNNIRNVNELDVVTFKIQGEDATQFLNESVQQAETFANAAESSATDAQTAEDGADLALYNFNGTWYGSLASEPTLDPNGEAITDGDLYSNSTDGILYFYQSGTWNPLGGGNVTSAFGRVGAVTATAGDYTATQVTYDNTTSGLTATDTQEAIDEVQASLGAAAFTDGLVFSTETLFDNAASPTTGFVLTGLANAGDAIVFVIDDGGTIFSGSLIYRGDGNHTDSVYSTIFAFDVNASSEFELYRAEFGVGDQLIVRKREHGVVGTTTMNITKVQRIYTELV